MKRTILRAGALTFAGLLLAAATAGASVLRYEPFYYPDGSLITVSHGAWAHHSGTLGQVQVVSHEVVLQEGVTSEDVNTALSAARGATDITYASFKLMVESGGSVGGTDYYAHFRFSGNFIYPGRMYIGPGSDFQLGIRATSTGATESYLPDLSYDTSYLVVSRFDSNTGDCTIWVDPSAEGDASATSAGGGTAAQGAEVDQYALRNGGTNSVNLHIDDLVVATSFDEVLAVPPAPGASTAGLLLLASLMLGAGAFYVTRRRATVA